MVTIAATVRVKEGKAEELKKEFLLIQPKVLKDPGAIAYGLYHSVKDPSRFFVFEQYENDEALDYHMSTEHFKAFFSKIEPLMAGEPVVDFCEEVK